MRDELRELVERMPVPEGSWHPHADLIRRLRAELLADLEHVDEARLEEQLDRPLPPPRPGSALAEVPVPAGEHPFLQEILPVLEAARLVQAASLPS